MSEDFANVVLGADTKRLIKAIEDLRKLAKAGGDTEKKLANAMKALEAVSAGFNTNMAKAAKAYADSLVVRTKEEQKANAASLKSAQEQARLKAAAEKAAHTESLRQARLAAAEKAAVEKAAQMESARATRLANAAKITEERKLARDRAAAQKATEKALKDSELQIRQVRNLAGNLDPAIGAAQRYNDTLRRLNQAVTAGLMPQEEANRLMAMAATRYRDAEIANDLFHTKFSRNMTGLTRIGRANVTQFAYQIQDIGIQLQAGQNAMIIFAQQGSQIASLFGPQGAIVGAVIGLAGALAGFLLPSLMDTKTQIESITDANKEFGRSISELKDISSMSLDSVKEKYGRIDDVLVGLLTRQQQVKEETARSDASRVIDALTEKYGELMRVSQLQSKAGAIAAQELKTKLGLTSQEVAKLIRAYNDAKTASSFKEQAEALVRIDSILASSTEAFTAFGQEVTTAALQMREVEYQTRMSEAAMRELAAGVPRQGWLMEAISAATTLATTLWDAARAKGALLSMPGIKGPAGMGDSSTATVRALEGINAAAYHVYGMVREMAPKTTRALEGVNAAAYAVYAQTREITSPEAQRALESVNAGAYAVYAQTRNMADEYIAAGEAGAAGGSAAAAGMTEAEKATKAAEEAAAEYANTLAGYVSSAVDAVVNDMVNGFKGGFEGILDGFINMLKQMMAYAIANPIKVALGLAAPMAGTPAAAGGTVPTGILGQISGIGTAFGSGISAVWEGLAANGLTGGMSAISGALSSVTGTLGSLATAAGALVLPIAALAAVFSFFKTKTKVLDSGLRLTIDGIDTLVEQFTKVQKSRFWGLSKSKRTSYSAVDAEVSGPIVKAVTDIEKSVMDAAENLGIASTTFDNFAHVLKLSTKGMSQDEAIQALQDKLVEMGDAFAGMVPGLADLQKEGEGAMEAITRLSQALTAVNHITDTLGLSFEAIGLAGADMASKLADAFGGIESMNGATSNYYDRFYSEAEKNATAIRQATAALEALGGRMPHSRDEYRAMVASLDLTTEAGRNLFAALVGMSSVMDQILPKVGAFTEVIQTLVDSLQTNLDAALSAAKEAQSNALESAKSWRSASKNIRDYIDGLQSASSAGVSPAQALAFNQARFQRLMSQALAGNRQAYDDLTGAADNLLSSVTENARSSYEVALAQAKMVANLGSVANVADATATRDEVVAGLLDQEIIILESIRDYLAGGGTDVARLSEMNAQLTSLQGTIVGVADLSLSTAQESVSALNQINAFLASSGFDAARMDTLAEYLAGIQASIDEASILTQVQALNQPLGEVSSNLVLLVNAINDDIEQRAASAAFILASLAAMLANQQPPATPSVPSTPTVPSGTGLSGDDIARLMERFSRARLMERFHRGNLDGITFAGGGDHSGGIRLVGENGPELEATGRSRIFSASQTKRILGGSRDGNNNEIIRELVALRRQFAELQEQTRQIQTQILNDNRRVRKITEDWDANGMPAVRA